MIRKLLVPPAKMTLPTHRWMLGKMRRPVPVRYWQIFRRTIALFSARPDALSPSLDSIIINGSALPIAELQSILADDELGKWSLDVATIVRLWALLRAERPRFIIECGSGISTIVLAKFLSLHADGSRRLVSLEQDMSWLQHSATRLKALGLARFVRLLHVPVSPEGEYLFPGVEEMRAELDGHRVDWIVIDGPFGKPGCRANTLPFLSQLARPGARWCLDDALRDGELSFLPRWSNNPNLSVQGIWPTGKGLATGHIGK